MQKPTMRESQTPTHPLVVPAASAVVVEARAGG